MTEGGASSKARGAVRGALDAAGERLGGQDADQGDREPRRRRRDSE